MKIIVAGLGKIGMAVLSSLASEGHDVTGIDIDLQTAKKLDQKDAIGVVGSAADYHTLHEAGVRGAALFIATTGSDELNMLSCLLAKQLGAVHTVARIRNPGYDEDSLRFMRDHLDIDMVINPDSLAAQELYNTLRFPSAMKLEMFSRRSFAMVELRLKQDSPLCGIPLHSLRSRFRANFLICAVQRGEQVCIPSGDFVLEPEDKLELTADLSELHKLLKEMDLLKKQVRSVMLLGGSKTAVYLARQLAATGSFVRIVEKDKATCHELELQLGGRHVDVLLGDGSQEAVLTEEGLVGQDAFVALTGNDEQNILLSFYAASQGVQKVIAKVNREDLGKIAERMGLDNRISLLQITANIMLRYARALESSGSNTEIETLYRLMDGKVEALEFIVNDESAVTGKPLRALRLKNNILFAGILRERKPILPTGEDCILPGDHVIVLAANHRLQTLTDILEVGK